MLRPWINSGIARSRVYNPRPLYSFVRRVSSTPIRQTAAADRVPLRKQLKQEAKGLKAQKKQRKEHEEASRQTWELTVGVEIHAQLDTAAKLFSSTFKCCCVERIRSRHFLTHALFPFRSGHFD